MWRFCLQQKAFPSWLVRLQPAEKRFTILNKIAELIDENVDATCALAETNDNGKPLWLSKKVDIPRASSNFRFFATALMHFASESHSYGRQSCKLYDTATHWNCRLYLTLEPAIVFIYLENSTCFGRRKLCDCQTF
jgi:aminomuconate-semialdehyde/2-hydroxymuconate-6-semialdehyde dehydrogenase